MPTKGRAIGIDPPHRRLDKLVVVFLYRPPGLASSSGSLGADEGGGVLGAIDSHVRHPGVRHVDG